MHLRGTLCANAQWPPAFREFVYFAGHLLAVLDTATGAWNDMIWANGEKVAIAAGSATSGVLYELLDPLGSTAVVTGSGGQVEGTNVLLPYGQLEQSAASVDPYVYTGKERDPENGSDHAWFRNYASAQMRWLRPDPYDGSYDLTNPQSLNRYAYVENNPLAFTDPTGLYVVAGCSQCWGGGVPNQGGGGGDGEFFWMTTLGTYFDLGGTNTQIDGIVYASSNTLWIPAGIVPAYLDLPGYTATSPAFASSAYSTAPSKGTVPVHGPWTYGNFCGAGGTGTPINGTDAACQAHDQCYSQGGFSPGSNFQGPNAQLQACNQTLCNAVNGARQSIINQAAANGTRNSRGVSPVYLPGQEGEMQADSEINFYFTWIVAPGGNACH